VIQATRSPRKSEWIQYSFAKSVLTEDMYFRGKGKDTGRITIKDSKMVYMEDFTKAHKM